jgi:hypothetical protein
MNIIHLRIWLVRSTKKPQPHHQLKIKVLYSKYFLDRFWNTMCNHVNR